MNLYVHSELEAPILPYYQNFKNSSKEDFMEKSFKPLFEKFLNTDDVHIPITSIRQKLLERKEKGKIKIKEFFKVEDLLQKIDTNQDHNISYDEFKHFIIRMESVEEEDKNLIARLIRSTAQIFVPKKIKDLGYRKNMNCHPPPIFTTLITLTNIIIFTYYTVKTKNSALSNEITLFNSVLIYDKEKVVKELQIWRLFTYSFLHAGWHHIIPNVAFQILLGITLELVHKWWRTGIIYCLGVISGSVSSGVLDSNRYLLGSSGGVFALLAAHVADVILNYKEMRKDDLNLTGRYRIIFVVLIALTSLIEYYLCRKFKTHTDDVSLFSHLFGSLTGLLIGMAILKDVSNNNNWKPYIKLTGLILFFLVNIFLLIIQIFNSTI